MNTKKKILAVVGALIAGYGIYTIGYYQGGVYAFKRCREILDEETEKIKDTYRTVKSEYTVE